MAVSTEGETLANDAIIEPFHLLPIWREKFARWKTLQKGCPAAGGAAGAYCFFNGRPCCYMECPMRTFEEERIDVEKIPLPAVPQKITVRLDVMQKEIDALKPAKET